MSALDAIDEDETKLKFEFIKSRFMQEEQRISMLAKSAQEKSEAASLVMNQSKKTIINSLAIIDSNADAFAATSVNVQGISSQDVILDFLI